MTAVDKCPKSDAQVAMGYGAQEHSPDDNLANKVNGKPQVLI